VWIVPWISRMARPEGVWRRWGRGFVWRGWDGEGGWRGMLGMVGVWLWLWLWVWVERLKGICWCVRVCGGLVVAGF